MNGKLIDPPAIVIEAGYNMMQARRNWPDGDYLGKAIALVEEARDYMVKHYDVLEIQASETLYFLNEAAHAQIQHRAGNTTDDYRLAQGGHAIGRAHNAARVGLQEAGFRPITNSDFDNFGDGGSR